MIQHGSAYVFKGTRFQRTKIRKPIFKRNGVYVRHRITWTSSGVKKFAFVYICRPPVGHLLADGNPYANEQLSFLLAKQVFSPSLDP